MYLKYKRFGSHGFAMKPTIHVYTIMLDWSFEKYIASVLTFDDLQNKVSQTEVNFKFSTYPKPLLFVG